MTMQTQELAAPTLSKQEFAQIRDLIFRIAGISMGQAKMHLVSGRLAKRLRHYGISSFGEYFRFITASGNEAELQTAVDLLTTNETHFFREPKHFSFLRDQVLLNRRRGRAIRIWSAASSTGEEPYSIAMLLADCLGDEPWEVVASDISTRVLEQASSGVYSMARARELPRDYLNRFCLKGVGSNEGRFLIAKNLRSKVTFLQVNLNEAFPALGEFDVIFLRNVMIYFEQQTKQRIVHRMLPLLTGNSYLFIGHSETLNGVTDAYRAVQPAIYQKTRS
ncbi:MAG: protein-glutamate O-methyltransferase CheR [Methylococcaceae bacterium]|nr:protein-glutamate O-methyltransferase CheR [Methylococcaceae bacterium]